jgi:hypothetical protein
MDQKVAEALLNGFMAGVREKAWREFQELRFEAQSGNPETLIAIVKFLKRCDIITDEQAVSWEATAKVCPETSQHGGGRSWCYYCGDVDEQTGLPINPAPETMRPRA